jgi:DNA-binding transcriptional regulator YbjK
METSLLKGVHISSKTHKISILIAHNEVSTLLKFLESTLQTKFLILNTNLGLEIYYYSDKNLSALITNTLLLITSKKKKDLNHFRIKSFTSKEKLSDEMQQSLKKLANAPLSLRCYTQNLFKQLNENYVSNKKIIEELFCIWKQLLSTLCLTEISTNNFNQFINSIEEFKRTSTFNPILKILITDAINSIRQN